MAKRVYAKGVFDFEKIVKSGAVISDKTELIYNMVHDNDYVFLSRPRRFGKSLLCSQLKFYFQGRKELFANFKIAELEKEWVEYPVFSFTMSLMKERDPEKITDGIYAQLQQYVKQYGSDEHESTPGAVFGGLIRRAYEQTGRGVVVIIDEYDAPLLAKERSHEEMAQVRSILLDFYQQIKDSSSYIRFAFLTGITRFSNLSIFSALNNLRNISMSKEYATICGITGSELETVFKPDVEILAEELGRTYEQTMDMLKERYDGYHFCKSQKDDIYNPFSLTLAFADKEMNNYWFASGTPSMLGPYLRKYDLNLSKLDETYVAADDFDVPLDGMATIYPLLYQSGYLTIKDYDPELDCYRLGFPNGEVRSGFLKCLLAETMGVLLTDTLPNHVAYCLRRNDVDGAMQHLAAYFASIPYLEHGEKELERLETYEALYQKIFYAVFGVFCNGVQTEVRCATGRCDVVFKLAGTTYIMEIKLARDKDKPKKLLAEAFAQMQEKNYAGPYIKPGARVVLIAAVFSRKTRTIEQWETREL